MRKRGKRKRNLRKEEIGFTSGSDRKTERKNEKKGFERFWNNPNKGG